MYEELPIQPTSDEELRRLIRDQNATKFMEIYQEELVRSIRTSPGKYRWASALVEGGPTENIRRFCAQIKTALLTNGNYSVTGEAFVATCTKLGIKNTRKAVEEFIAGTKG